MGSGLVALAWVLGWVAGFGMRHPIKTAAKTDKASAALMAAV